MSASRRSLLRASSKSSGFEFGEVNDEMISYPPYRLVRGTYPWRLAIDGYLYREAVPLRPGFRQVQHVAHHAGHDVGGVPVIDLRSGISHEDIMLGRADISGRRS